MQTNLLNIPLPPSKTSSPVNSASKTYQSHTYDLPLKFSPSPQIFFSPWRSGGARAPSEPPGYAYDFGTMTYGTHDEDAPLIYKALRYKRMAVRLSV